MKRPVVALVAAAAGWTASAAPPDVGRYDARMCVKLGDAMPSCGPVDAQVLRENRVLVRISDMVYQLKLNGGHAEVALMHGAMLIDEFVAAYAWEGATLGFVDADKRTRYELTLGAPSR